MALGVACQLLVFQALREVTSALSGDAIPYVHASLGRSPMQQLTYLRIQYAAHQLATAQSKIEEIALRVGT